MNWVIHCLSQTSYEDKSLICEIVEMIPSMVDTKMRM